MTILYLYIFTQLLTIGKNRLKINFFKQTTEFRAFCLKDWLQAKEHSIPYYLLITGQRRDGFKTFLGRLQVKCKQPSPRFELCLLSPFPMMLTIAPLALPFYCICM